jgi:hypothetical protein
MTVVATCKFDYFIFICNHVLIVLLSQASVPELTKRILSILGTIATAKAAI